MATLKSKKLQDALKKARNVGRAEEPVTVDGCSLVLRGLAPKDYENIVNETTELDGIEYHQSYQMGHVCRSIVEIEGVDLREVDFIEDDVPAGQYVVNATCSKSKAEEAKTLLAERGIALTIVPPDGSEGERTVLVERHEWVRQRVSSWSRETLMVLFHKFADVVAEGERRAREKVEFRVPDETNEDRFRRLLGEMKEVAAQLPPDLTKNIMDTAGYVTKATPEELEEVTRRAREFAIEQAKLKEEVVASAPQPAAQPAPPPVARYEAPEPPPEPSPQPAVQPGLQQELMDRLRNRVPMNRTALQAPVPPSATQTPPAGVPPQLRSSQIAALEGDLGSPPVAYEPQINPPREIPELSRNIPQVDGKGVQSIIDKPPVVGINPRFQRRT